MAAPSGSVLVTAVTAEKSLHKWNFNLREFTTNDRHDQRIFTDTPKSGIA